MTDTKLPSAVLPPFLTSLESAISGRLNLDTQQHEVVHHIVNPE